MITEDYVSYEVAKLLKEKGFDEYSVMVYNQNGSFMPNGAIEDTYQSFYFAPTHQMAMKWLREVHNLHIVVFHYDNLAFPYIWYIFAHNKDKPHKANSYEEAVEAALKYTLENLI